MVTRAEFAARHGFGRANVVDHTDEIICREAYSFSDELHKRINVQVLRAGFKDVSRHGE